MAGELGSAFEAVLRELVRRVVLEELGRVGDAFIEAVDDHDDVAQLAALRAARLRRARSKGGAL